MITQPWLSVLIPTYNGEAYLSSALDSILIQEDNDIECIITDDGSTDATLSILNDYKDKLSIKILQRERQGNWVANTNYALSFAQGEYVCFLHHDDLWFKDRLKITKQLTQQFPKVILFLHPSNFINGDGNYMGLWSCPLPAFPEIIKTKLMTERLLVQNFISILGAVFRRDIALKVGGLDESLWYTADWDFWLKIVARGDTLYYPKPLSGFRIHQDSQTIIRSSYLQDFRAQLEHVAIKHMSLWEAPEPLKKMVRKAANFSIEVNSTLAGAMHGAEPKLLELFCSFLLLGPSGWHRYLRDSRIWERVSARLRARLTTSSKQ